MPDDDGARQFWASGLLGQPDVPPSYQKLHQEEHWRGISDKSPSWENAFEHSNDPLLDDLWKKVLALAPPHLANALSGTFIVKRQDWESQASTWASPHHFAGAIIDFHVGFSDATVQFATFFERVRDPSATPFRVADDARRMAYVAELWRETGEVYVGDYGYEGEDLTSHSVALSLLADVWCLAHEGAHRLLGHVDGIPRVVDDELEVLLGDLADAFSETGGQELEADALATLLLRGQDPFDARSQSAFEACLGAHLALNTLRLGDPQSDRGDDDHPPIDRRLALNLKFQERLTGGDYASAVRADVERAAGIVEATIRAATALEADQDKQR
ncbi:hypothetical protein [Nocardioides okcheonensis]|uniref:hypothetical protein n=1 Tax=Nocardioides okcheonensis TaxID=2894081 RepID=UPI001E2E84A6|nr:hypothetical protein [Nocardioides okcheonensis]UFN43283.1 hypothetical protein LN652_14685 [Nocardioides okcheonensis]